MTCLVNIWTWFIFLCCDIGFGEVCYTTSNSGDCWTYAVASKVTLAIQRNHYITFKIKACKYAYIALVNGDPSYDPLYEIVLDSAGYTIIRTARGKVPPEYHLKMNVLNCTSFKEFWISWEEYCIKIGTGLTPEINMFAKWESRTKLHPIKYLGYCTGHGAVGEWCFFKKARTTTMDSGQGNVTSNILIPSDHQPTTRRNVKETTYTQASLPVSTGTEKSIGVDANSNSNGKASSFKSDAFLNSSTALPYYLKEYFSTYLPSHKAGCMCPCSKVGSHSYLDISNLTKKELRYLLLPELEAMRSLLTIPKQSISKFIGKKTSAVDRRPSSRYLGCVAIVIVCIPLVLTVLSDLFNIFI